VVLIKHNLTVSFAYSNETKKTSPPALLGEASTFVDEQTYIINPMGIHSPVTGLCLFILLKGETP